MLQAAIVDLKISELLRHIVQIVKLNNFLTFWKNI